MYQNGRALFPDQCWMLQLLQSFFDDGSGIVREEGLFDELGNVVIDFRTSYTSEISLVREERRQAYRDKLWVVYAGKTRKRATH